MLGAVSDNFDQRIDQKIFHAEIVVDAKAVDWQGTKKYKDIPQLTDFGDSGDEKIRQQIAIQKNYDDVRQSVKDIIEREVARIKADPSLSHLWKNFK